MKSNGKMLVPLAVLITILALPTSTLIPSVFATPTVLWVAPLPATAVPPGTSCSAPGYHTISAAVAAAAAGDTIYVCTGTYTEQVTITIPLTLTGVPYPTPTSPAPTIGVAGISPLVKDAFGEANIVTIGSSSGAITVTFQGFTVTGPGPSTCGSINNGIFVEYGATAYILQNTIEHIRDQPISGCQNGHGISVGVASGYNDATSSTVGYAKISGNTILDYQKGGIDVDNTGSMAAITGNTVTGVGPTAIAQNGIEVLTGALATVDSNTVSGNECNSSGCGSNYIYQTQSAGILTDASGATVVNDNTVSGNDVGILTYTGAVKPSVAVTNNVVQNNRYEGMYLSDGTYTASNNKISGSPIGIAVVSDGYTPGPTTVSLTGNEFTGTFSTAQVQVLAYTGAPYGGTNVEPVQLTINGFVETVTAQVIQGASATTPPTYPPSFVNIP